MPNDSREKILRRIREALSVSAPARHLSGAESSNSGHKPQDWLPPVPRSPSALVALFEKNSLDLKTDVRLCADAATVATELAALARENDWTDREYTSAALEVCDAGVTGCECLVAQTGGILVTSASSGGRVLSVLPPHHVVIASTSQLVGDLADAFEVLRKNFGSPPAFASFITGPSRTGDIERILVLGAHGPKKLTVLLVQA